MKQNHSVDTAARVYILRHIENGEFICLRQEGREYLACFSDGDSAYQFREELGLLEHVDIAGMCIGNAPFDHFWLDGEMVGRNILSETPAVSVN